MKIQNIVLWVMLIFFIVLASSCTQSTESVTSVPSETFSRPTSTVTSIPSLTPLPTDSSTSTPAPTMILTLPVEESRTRLLGLLANNGDCRLPCLWGITLGKSSFQEVQGILAPLSSLSHSVYLDSPGAGGIIPRYSEGDLEIYTAVGFVTNPDDGIVNHVTFNAEIHRPVEQGGYEDVFDSKFFDEKVSAYTLPHVLSEQGIPSSVMLATSGGPLTRGGTGGFDIMLLYPNRGILVNYTTQVQLIGTIVRGCPSNAHVEMELYPSEESDSFFDLLEETDWGVKMDYYKPLEEVTSLSIEQFYEVFREPTDKCIETSANLWPTPEP